MQANGAWPEGVPGRLRLPSGRTVVGRGRRSTWPGDAPEPEFELVLAGRRERERPAWPSEILRWPDFGVPADRDEALRALRAVLERSTSERVAMSCRGGRGRTGTALACLAVLDGVGARAAVAYVRTNYDRHAVETPWQARFVRRLERPAAPRRP